MFEGLSDSGLGSYSFWLSILGFVGVLAVVVSMAGLHFVNMEVALRATTKMAAARETAEHADQEVAAARQTKAEHAVLAPAGPPAREITEQQRKEFISLLADVPKRPFGVFVYEHDPEIEAYADQIRVMLVMAGYDCGPQVKSGAETPQLPIGVLIVVKDPARAPAFAGAIQNAFRSVGIEALGAVDSDLGTDQAAVVVGRRRS